MSQAVDLTKPIEVVDVYGIVSAAKYVRPLDYFPEHHVILFEGEEHVIDSENRVVGRPGKASDFDEDYYQLRNYEE